MYNDLIKYLEGIDPTKRFFLQSDMDEFAKYEAKIDDMIKSKDLTFFDLTNSRLLKRIILIVVLFKIFWQNLHKNPEIKFNSNN